MIFLFHPVVTHFLWESSRLVPKNVYLIAWLLQWITIVFFLRLVWETRLQRFIVYDTKMTLYSFNRIQICEKYED